MQVKRVIKKVITIDGVEVRQARSHCRSLIAARKRLIVDTSPTGGYSCDPGLNDYIIVDSNFKIDSYWLREVTDEDLLYLCDLGRLHDVLSQELKSKISVKKIYGQDTDKHVLKLLRLVKLGVVKFSVIPGIKNKEYFITLKFQDDSDIFSCSKTIEDLPFYNKYLKYNL